MSSRNFQTHTHQNHRCITSKCSHMFVMENITAKHATFSGNVIFNYANDNKDPFYNDDEDENITINDIISDIKFLKKENRKLNKENEKLNKENRKLKEIVDILWNAPPGGGPGYQEANENWKNHII